MGDYYINVPASSESYESPALFAADPTQEPASGGNGHIVVGGIYFHWDSATGGFSNTGWWGADLNYGPTHSFGTDQAVINYLSFPGNDLDSYFKQWQQEIDLQGEDGKDQALQFHTELVKAAIKGNVNPDECASLS